MGALCKEEVTGEEGVTREASGDFSYLPAVTVGD
jgi:hypothetical protein